MPAAAPSAQSTCPRCQKPLTFRLACAGCGELFADPKLDAFAQLGLAPAWTLDLKRLSDNYLAVSRLAHPDRHVNGAEAVQDRAEAVMALANRARATLLDDRARAEALLARLAAGAGLKPAVKQQPPADFLMEIMEITEAVAQAGDSEKTALIDNIRSRIGGIQSELAQQFSRLLPAGPEPAPAATVAAAALNQTRDLIDRWSYWHRLYENATGAGEHKLVS